MYGRTEIRHAVGKEETFMSQEREERGFAAMDPEERRRIAEKGGQAVSKDREHMSEIGRKGGEASGEKRSKDNDR
jgi:general stress protein YciG